MKEDGLNQETKSLGDKQMSRRSFMGGMARAAGVFAASSAVDKVTAMASTADKILGDSDSEKSIERRDFTVDFNIADVPDDFDDTAQGKLFKEAIDYYGSDPAGRNEYVEQAMKQILVKYGPDKFNQTLDKFLNYAVATGDVNKDEAGKIFKRVSLSLATNQNKERVNKYLYNFADNIGDNGEKMMALAELLRKEGYKKDLSLHKFDQKFINEMLTDGALRADYLEWYNADYGETTKVRAFYEGNPRFKKFGSFDKISFRSRAAILRYVRKH